MCGQTFSICFQKIEDKKTRLLQRLQTRIKNIYMANKKTCRNLHRLANCFLVDSESYCRIWDDDQLSLNEKRRLHRLTQTSLNLHET